MQSFRQKNLKKEKNCCQDLLFRECLLHVRKMLSSHNGNKTKIKSQLSLSQISREMRLHEAIGPCCYLQKIPVFLFALHVIHITKCRTYTKGKCGLRLNTCIQYSVHYAMYTLYMKHASTTDMLLCFDHKTHDVYHKSHIYKRRHPKGNGPNSHFPCLRVWGWSITHILILYFSVPWMLIALLGN